MGLDLGGNIRNACEKNGYTLNEVEKAVGLPEGTVTTWDPNDDDPAIIQSVIDIADFLGESLDFVVRGEAIVSKFDGRI